jgi:hypothetical protein
MDTFPRMDDATILRLLDVERQTVADTGVTLEKTPYVVRAIGLESSWNGIVYSRFSPSESETIVNAEIKYFTQLNRDFEWKVYSHDEPRDLLSQLRNRGLRIGEEESLMIRDLSGKDSTTTLIFATKLFRGASTATSYLDRGVLFTAQPFGAW